MAWTKVPPSEPGHYWVRYVPSDGSFDAERDRPMVWERDEDGKWRSPGDDSTLEYEADQTSVAYEFWPERIEPPREG